MKMKKSIMCAAAAAALCLGSLIAGESVYRGVTANGGYDSDSGSISNLPAGAWVIVEGGGTSTAVYYAAASGGGVNISVSGSGGAGDYACMSYADSVSYSVSINGYGYAFVEVEWGYN